MAQLNANMVSVESPELLKWGKKVLALRSLLDDDLHAADIRWSLFHAACQHYRWDSCLKPFPTEFVVDGVKDIDKLLSTVSNIASMAQFAKYLQDDDLHTKNRQVIDLAYWVLISSKDMQLVTLDRTNHCSVLLPCETSAQPPDWIFQVQSKTPAGNEAMWQGQKKLYAYHGSRLENFYSILHHGLQQHLNKNSLFGQGVYLSSELSVSLPYSPTGTAWEGSAIGSQLSCVALCEMMDHPDVKCQGNSQDPARAITRDSIGGEVPNKYYLVRNSDLVRVRYLLVYTSTKPIRAALNHASSWRMLRWVRRNRLATLTLVYVAVLMLVGLSNNPQFQRHYKNLWKKIKPY